MIWQIIFLIAGQLVELIISWTVPLTVWNVLGKAYSGISTLVQWTPKIPLVPYAAIYYTVTVYVMAWGGLFLASLWLRVYRMMRGNV